MPATALASGGQAGRAPCRRARAASGARRLRVEGSRWSICTRSPSRRSIGAAIALAACRWWSSEAGAGRASRRRGCARASAPGRLRRSCSKATGRPGGRRSPRKWTWLHARAAFPTGRNGTLGRTTRGSGGHPLARCGPDPRWARRGRGRSSARWRAAREAANARAGGRGGHAAGGRRPLHSKTRCAAGSRPEPLVRPFAWPFNWCTSGWRRGASWRPIASRPAPRSPRSRATATGPLRHARPRRRRALGARHTRSRGGSRTVPAVVHALSQTLGAPPRVAQRPLEEEPWRRSCSS